MNWNKPMCHESNMTFTILMAVVGLATTMMLTLGSIFYALSKIFGN